MAHAYLPEHRGDDGEDLRLRLVVLERNGQGGITEYTHALCGSLAEAGASVCLVTPARDPLPACGEPYEVRNVLRRNVGHARFRALAVEARNAVATLTQILRHKPDAVLVEAPEPGRLDELWVRVVRARGIRVIWAGHQIALREWGNRLEPFARRLYERVDGMITLSKSERDRLAESMPELARATEVIPHGSFSFLVDSRVPRHEARLMLGLPPEVPVLLFFGFLKPYKGLDVFLDALSLLGSRGVEVLGYVAGAPVTAQQERNLRARAAQADLVDMVVLRLGFVDKSEMPAIFGACDLTVAPYKIASQSGVIQMSYAYGRPVVVTDVGGLGDDVDEGETGTIAEASGPEALADTIERLLSDSSQLAAMTEKLEQGPPERFAWDHVAAAHLAYITSRLER